MRILFSEGPTRNDNFTKKVITIMGKRLLTFLSVTIAGFVFFAVGTLTADDMPEEIQIASEGYKRKIHKPVKFTHLMILPDESIKPTRT